MTRSPSVAVIGHVCLDMTHAHDHSPKLNGKSPATHTDMILGGCAANTARFLQELGATTTLYSVLGDESSVLTQTTVQLLNSMGVHDKRFSFVPNAPATVSHVWVDQRGNRTISSYQDHQVVEYAPHMLEHMLSFRAALFDNYRWPLNMAILQKLETHCLKILDVDAPVTAQQWEYFKLFDQLWFSKETFADLKLSLSETAKITRASVVGVTDGENPVVWVDGSGIHQVQPMRVLALNTLGAGDAFRAGMVLGQLQDKSMCASVRLGCEVAAQHITQV